MNLSVDRRRLLRGGLAAAASVGVGGVVAPRPRLSRDHVVAWAGGYARAWETKDAAAAAALFTDDAVYQVIPGVDAQTYTGRDAIAAYWRDVTAGQSEISVRHGEPIVTGARAAVELWASFRVADGSWITLTEANVLTFAPDGLVERNVEYWTLNNARLEPPAHWGR